MRKSDGKKEEFLNSKEFELFKKENIILSQHEELLKPALKGGNGKFYKNDYYLIYFSLNKSKKINVKTYPKSKYFDPHKLYNESPIYEGLRKKFPTLLHLSLAIRNNWAEFPKCPYCGNLRKLKNHSEIYRTCGSKECSVKERSSTCEEKYGVSFFTETDLFKSKSSKSLMDHYGVKNPSQSNIIKERKKETCIKNFGYDNPSRVPEIKEKQKRKISETFRKKYKCDNIGGLIKLKSFKSSSKFKYIYKGEIFDSSYELAYYIYCEDHNIKINRNKELAISYKLNDKIYYYVPDFIDDSNQLIEIKGKCLEKDGIWIPHPASLSKCKNEESIENLKRRYKEKQKCAIENKVKIITEENIIPCIKYCQEKYGNRFWYKKFKYNKSNKIIV